MTRGSFNGASSDDGDRIFAIARSEQSHLASQVLALFGRHKRTQQCLLLGEKRTKAGRHSTSAIDPERTSALTEMFKIAEEQNRVDAKGRRHAARVETSLSA
jgi:hypothetical protein